MGQGSQNSCIMLGCGTPGQSALSTPIHPHGNVQNPCAIIYYPSAVTLLPDHLQKFNMLSIAGAWPACLPVILSVTGLDGIERQALPAELGVTAALPFWCSSSCQMWPGLTTAASLYKLIFLRTCCVHSMQHGPSTGYWTAFSWLAGSDLQRSLEAAALPGPA